MKKTGRLKQLLALILAGALTVGSVGTPVFGADFGDTVVKSVAEDEALDGGVSGEADDTTVEESDAGAESDDTIDGGISEEADDTVVNETDKGAKSDDTIDGGISEEADDAAAEESDEGTVSDDMDMPEESEDSNVEAYTVTLDANGGYFVNEWDDAVGDYVERAEVIEKKIPVGGTVINVVPIMEHESAAVTFLGWSLEPEGELVSQADVEYVPVENCVLYAVWQIEEAVQEENEETVDRSYETIEDTSGQEEEFSEEEAADVSSERDESEIGDTTDSTPPIAMDGSYIWPDEAEEAAEMETVTTEATAGAEQDAEELVLHDDYDAAIQDIRDQAKKRKETVQVKVSESVMIQMDGTSIWDDLFAHTGNPKEGDYLKYSGAYFYWDSCESLEDGTYLITLKFYAYYDNEEQETAVDQEVERIVSDLQLNSDSLDNYEKIKAIYAFITEQVQYDYETKDDGLDVHKEKFSAYGSVVEHNAVCQGYALMFYRLALEAGIDSRIITSKSGELDDGGHAWNIVQLDDLYYLLDTTWDAGNDEDYWDYFLKGKYDFEKHVNEDDQFHEDDFAAKYILADFYYGYSPDPLTLEPKGEAPEHTLFTWDNKIVNTSAQNGRAKVVISFTKDCSWCDYLFQSMRGKEFPGVDVIYVMRHFQATWMGLPNYDEFYQEQLGLIGSKYPLDVQGAYCFCQGADYMIEDFEKITGVGSKASPVVYMINADNQIIYADYGAQDYLPDLIEQNLCNPDAPDVSNEEDYGNFQAIGKCGNNAIWWFYEDGTLRISGKGNLWTEQNPSRSGIVDPRIPDGFDWGSYAAFNISSQDVINVIIDEDIGNMGGAMFTACLNLKTITFLNHGPDLETPLSEHEKSTKRLIQTDEGFQYIPVEFTCYRDMYRAFPVIPPYTTVYYPKDDASWTDDVKRLYEKSSSGNRWISIGQDGIHQHEWSEWKLVSHLEEGVLQADRMRFCEDCGACEDEDGSIALKHMGRCGDNAWWQYYEGGLLYINGKVGLDGSRPSRIGWSDKWQESPDNLDGSTVKRILLDENVGDIGPGTLGGMTCLEEIVFLGQAPDLEASPGEDYADYSTLKELYDAREGIFSEQRDTEVPLNIFYPENDTTWTSEVRECLSGRNIRRYTMRWYSHDESGEHHHIWGEWMPVLLSGNKNVTAVKGCFCDVCGACQYEDGSIVQAEDMRFCGGGVQWRYYEDGLLYISGNGDLLYNNSDSCPFSSSGIGWGNPDWDSALLDSALVRQILIDESIGNMDVSVFSDFSNLQTITFLNHAPDLTVSPPGEGYSEYNTLQELYNHYGGAIWNNDRIVIIYYPMDDGSWTDEMKQTLGKDGTCQWVPFDLDGTHNHAWGEWSDLVLPVEGDAPVVKGRFCDVCGACEYEDGSMVYPEYSGFCGNSARWKYFEGGLLYISGEGDLWLDAFDSSQKDNDPRPDRTKIRKVLVGRDIGTIGPGTFSGCSNLETVIFLNHAPELDASPSWWEGIEESYGTLRDFYETFGGLWSSEQAVPLTIYYLMDDESWTEEVKGFFGTIDFPENEEGIIQKKWECKWIPVDENYVHHHKWGKWTPLFPSDDDNTVAVKGRFCDGCGARQQGDGSVIRLEATCFSVDEWMGSESAYIRFYEDGLLYISGSGDLWDKDNLFSSSCTVWYRSAPDNIQSRIRRILIGEEVYSIYPGVFSDLENLETVRFMNRGVFLECEAPGAYWIEYDYDSVKDIFDEYGGLFPEKNLTVYYPVDFGYWENERLMEEMKKAYGRGASCRWIPVGQDGVHHHTWGAWKTIKAATVTQEGKKEHTCSTCGKKAAATIAKLTSITGATVTGISNATYTSKAIRPVPVVKLGTKTLKSGTDYTVSYKNNTNVGTATVTITGKGNYTGTVSKTFKINQASQTITVKAAASSVAVGKTTTVSLTGAKGTKSFKSSDTTIATVDKSTGKVTAKKVGTVKITASSAATANYKVASKTVTIKVVPAATASLTAANQATGIKLTWKKVTGATGYLVYRSSTKIATIKSGSTVTNADTKANTNGTKYTYKIIATASTGNGPAKSVTTYCVTRPAISSVTNSASKRMTVKWGKNAKASGYQIHYCTNKTFKSGNKSVSITSASTVSKVIGSLTKNKTYYIRIRTYKTVGSTKYFSGWSPVKSVKISK